MALITETVKLARKGRSFLGLCPFHQEKTPSFSVNAEKGFFYCFGCKESGNVFDFLMKVEGLTFPEAARRLAERSGIVIEETASDAERREADAARRAVEELYRANDLAAHWFETQLREHPTSAAARAELGRRGLDPAADDTTPAIRDALQAFRVGYAPPGWDGLAHYFVKQGISPLAAEKVGLLAARKSGSGHYDWFRNRLMFAILDVQGRVVGFSGRVLPDPETGKVDREDAKYKNSPESPVYQKGQTLFGLYQARQAIRRSDEAVVVEGNFDVVSLHARGINNVVAPLGTAFTGPQAKLLKRYTHVVTLLFDGDAAGRKATRDARDTCKEAGLSAKVAALPDGADPDEFVRTKGAGALTAAIRASRGILEHLIDRALDEKIFRADASERAARVREVVQLIASEDDPTVRGMGQMYADTIARRMTEGVGAGLPQATVARALSQAFGARPEGTPSGSASRGGILPSTTPAAPAAAASNASNPWQAKIRISPGEAAKEVSLGILGCVLDFPALLDDAEVQDVVTLLEGDPALAVAALRQSLRTPNANLGAEFLAHLPGALHTFAAQRLAAPRHEHADEARMELLDNAQKLKRLGLSREKAQVVEALHRMQGAGDAAAEDALLRELFERRAKQRHGI